MSDTYAHEHSPTHLLSWLLSYCNTETRYTTQHIYIYTMINRCIKVVKSQILFFISDFVIFLLWNHVYTKLLAIEILYAVIEIYFCASNFHKIMVDFSCKNVSKLKHCVYLYIIPDFWWHIINCLKMFRLHILFYISHYTLNIGVQINLHSFM